MDRITDKNLQFRVDLINKLTGSPDSPYVDGECQIGNFHLSHAYGGVCLHRMHNESGGVSTPLVSCHVPKRQLHDMLCAFIAGLEFNSN